MPDDDILRADPGRRRAALVLVLVGLLAGIALLAFLNRWMSRVMELPNTEAEAQLSTVLVWVTGGISGGLLLFAVALLHVGRKIGRVAVWPLPGSRVIRDTPILRGAEALKRGRVLQGAAVVLILAAAAIAFAAWRLHHAFGAAAS